MTNKKIIVFGSAGMAGHMIYSVLNNLNKYEIIDVAKSEKIFDTTKLLDVKNFSRVQEIIGEYKPDIVINCIGLLINESEEKPDEAILLNSYFPHFLSKMGYANNFKLIHLTTDCVFSGKTGKYVENSFRDGDNVYARTRALGEIINTKDLSIRTSLIGPELKNDGSGLLNWFINQKGVINGFSKALWTGVTTLELANAMDYFIDQNIFGLYHFVPANSISKYDLLNIFKKYWNKNVIINEDDNFHSDKSLINTRKDFNYKVKSYDDMINRLNLWMNENKHLYSHYFI